MFTPLNTVYRIHLPVKIKAKKKNPAGFLSLDVSANPTLWLTVVAVTNPFVEREGNLTDANAFEFEHGHEGQFSELVSIDNDTHRVLTGLNDVALAVLQLLTDSTGDIVSSNNRQNMVMVTQVANG